MNYWRSWSGVGEVSVGEVTVGDVSIETDFFLVKYVGKYDMVKAF